MLWFYDVITGVITHWSTILGTNGRTTQRNEDDYVKGAFNCDKSCRRRNILTLVTSPLWRYSHMTLSGRWPFDSHRLLSYIGSQRERIRYLHQFSRYLAWNVNVTTSWRLYWRHDAWVMTSRLDARLKNHYVKMPSNYHKNSWRRSTLKTEAL